jgi:hypothetical protein
VERWEGRGGEGGGKGRRKGGEGGRELAPKQTKPNSAYGGQ